MGVKYQVNYKDFQQNSWRLDIDVLGFEGTPIEVRSEREACNITYTPNEVDNPFSSIIYSEAKVTLYNTFDGEIDIPELQNAKDMDIMLNVYVNNSIYWSGYIVAEGITESLTASPYTVSLTAKDGLNLLDDLDFTVTNQPLPGGYDVRSALAHIRDVLWYNIKIRLDIGFINKLRVKTDNSFMFTDLPWSNDGDAYTDNDGNRVKCIFVLKNHLEASKMQIIQTNGRWLLRRIGDLTNGLYDFDKITFSGSLLSEDIDELQSFNFYNNSQSRRLEPGLKSFTQKYNPNIRTNNLPNGDFERTSLGSLLYWKFIDFVSGYLPSYELTPSIATRGVNSVLLSYPNYDNPAQSNEVFFTTDPIPVNTEDLYTNLTLGIVFSPLRGFAINTATGIINWDDNPFNIRVMFNPYGTTDTYYLNPFGYWVKKRYLITPPVYGTIISSGVAGFRPFFNTDIYVGAVLPGDTLTFTATYNSGVKYTVSYKNTQEYMSFEDFVNNFYNNLPVTWAKSLTPKYTSGVLTHYQLDFTMMDVYVPSGSTSGVYVLFSPSDTVGTKGEIPLKVDGMKVGDIASIEFNGRQEIKTIPTNGEITAQVMVKKGQQFIVDEFTMSFNNTVDEYTAKYYLAGTNSKVGEKEVYISTALTGFQQNNYMKSIFTSDESEVIVDEYSKEGTLTSLGAQSEMRQKYKFYSLIDCDLQTELLDLAYIRQYSGGKFIPLQGTYRTDCNKFDGATFVEIRNDNVSISVEHKKSD